jgi:tripartite-type tricarboxylate transporter receptor subunit TctC
LLSALIPSRALAQDYPRKTIRIIVPFTAGGGTDILARMLAQRLTEAWGQPAVVENRLGAAGTLAASFVAKSPPDGYTLLFGTTSTHGIAPHLYKELPYDPVKDFSPVSLMVWAPNVLVVHPSLPVKSVKQLIAFAKANPGRLLFPSSGNGSSIHLAGELFKSLAHVEMVHVPYKGANQALVDLVSGQMHLMFATIATVQPFFPQGRLRPLGVTTPKRTIVLPDVPSIAEAGLPGYEMSGWIGLLAPAQTQREIVAKINGELASFVQSPAVKRRILEQGWEPVGSPAQVLADVIMHELPKYAKVIKDAKMAAE